MISIKSLDKRWLLLGAGGQLGQEWANRLEDDGCDYKALSRNDLDITNQTSVAKTVAEYRPDIIINTAAYTAVDNAEGEIEAANQINNVAPGQLARICAEYGIMLVHYSTDYVFPGRLDDRNRYPDGYPETAAAEPVNTYGRTKWLGEEAIRKENGQHLILRVSWLCGHHGKNFIHTMLRLANERDQVSVVNDQYGCPTFTAPTVENTIALIRAEARGTYHISSAGETTWYEFACAIFKERGIQVFERTGKAGNDSGSTQTNENVDEPDADDGKAPLTVMPVSTPEFPTRAKRPAWSRLGIKRLAEVRGSRILPWQEELALFMRDLKK